jgi:hypothetical protein
MLSGSRSLRTVRAEGGVHVYRIARADLAKLFRSGRQRRALQRHRASANARCSLDRRDDVVGQWVRFAAGACARATAAEPRRGSAVSMSLMVESMLGSYE